MPMIVVVGTQWGDEGKGKIVDLYAKDADVVARYGGGANAGHTTWLDDKKYVTHLLPSGILQGKMCVLGAGMVIDPKQLLAEIDDFAKKGIDVSPRRIMISPSAHIVLPSHQTLDAVQDGARGKNALGTTKKGIGPTYADKASRRGLRAGTMLSPLQFGLDARALTAKHHSELQKLLGATHVDLNPQHAAEEYASKLAPYIKDTSFYLHQCLTAGKTVLAEGAQGTLLDVDHGGYPHVTSSSVVAGAAATGLGVSPKFINKIIGVAKCFQTRVGEGPMPTEIIGDRPDSIHLRGKEGEPGAEYGATTGRPRRVGWLDLPLLRYAIRVNGLDELVLTKLDALSGLEVLKICVAYEDRGKTYPEIPDNGMVNLEDFFPQYEFVVPWKDALGQARDFDNLDVRAQSHVQGLWEQRL